VKELLAAVKMKLSSNGGAAKTVLNLGGA
jgi:hypothetical protein